MGERPAAPRCLPVYGGDDAGPRPGTREAVFVALGRGWAPSRIAEVTGLGIDETITGIEKAGYPGGRPACVRGCSHCCHQRVEITPPEALSIAKRVRETWSHDARASLLGRLDATAARMRARASARDVIRCAFLDDEGACTIYETRPHACRRGHSLDAEACRVANVDPASEARIPDSAALSWNTAAVVLGYREGFARAGLPLGALELCAAVAAALRDDGAEARWLGKEGDVFEGARTKTEAEVADILARER